VQKLKGEGQERIRARAIIYNQIQEERKEEKNQLLKPSTFPRAPSAPNSKNAP
jgi:hypothetical protein